MTDASTKYAWFIPNICGLATIVILNTKLGETENKIPVSGSVKKTIYDAKILNIDKIYFNTSGYKKFTSEILDTKIKQKNKSINLIFLLSQEFWFKHKTCNISNKSRIKIRAR